MRSLSSFGAIDVKRSGGIQGRSRWLSAEMRLYCMAFSPGFPNYAPSGGPGNGSISIGGRPANERKLSMWRGHLRGRRPRAGDGPLLLPDLPQGPCSAIYDHGPRATREIPVAERGRKAQRLRILAREEPA